MIENKSFMLKKIFLHFLKILTIIIYIKLTSKKDFFSVPYISAISESFILLVNK